MHGTLPMAEIPSVVRIQESWLKIMRSAKTKQLKKQVGSGLAFVIDFSHRVITWVHMHQPAYFDST